MPVFCQWKWQEKTQTFLLILHFDADGSQRNLRNREMTFVQYRHSAPNVQSYAPSHPPMEICRLTDELKRNIVSNKQRVVTTWAPSHVEIGLMSEVLCYANIINGLKLDYRKELITKLDLVFYVMKDAKLLRLGNIDIDDELLRANWLEYVTNFISLKEATENNPYLEGCDYNYREQRCESVFCTMLSVEYIDYLKDILKPYMV